MNVTPNLVVMEKGRAQFLMMCLSFCMAHAECMANMVHDIYPEMLQFDDTDLAYFAKCALLDLARIYDTPVVEHGRKLE